ILFFFFQAEDGIRDFHVTGVQTCALPICYTLGTTLVMHSNFIHNKATFSHEVIHIYQYYDYNFLNSFLSKPIYNSKLLSQFDFLYYDLQGAILNPLYLLEKNRADKYFDNFFEKEAGFYSNTITDF